MTLTNPPEEFTEWQLIRALQGAYTAEQLNGLPAHKIRRWLVIMEELDREAAAQARKAASKGRR